MAIAKRNSLKTVDATALLNGVYLAKFNGGHTFAADVRELPTVDGEGKIVGKWGDAGWNALPPMAQRTMVYGLKQKLDDSMAGVEGEKEAIEELESTWAAIVGNGWTVRVQGEGVEGGLFARAYAEFKGVSLSDAKVKIAAMVEKNVKANKAAAKTAEEAEKITDRRVFNGLRDNLLARHADLNKIYEDLKAKRDQKAKEKAAGGLEFDTTEE